MPNSVDSSTTDGTRLPTGYDPSAMRSAMTAATCRQTGRVRSSSGLMQRTLADDLADIAEATRLDMGARLLAHADDMLPNATETQLRFLAERLTEALRDILRVAESRDRKP